MRSIELFTNEMMPLHRLTVAGLVPGYWFLNSGYPSPKFEGVCAKIPAKPGSE